jgi:hypothetical protein
VYDGVLLLACAVTVSERGDMGFMAGRIGIGAMLEGPLVHVVLFPACGLVLLTGRSLAAGTGEGRGAAFSFPVDCGVPALSDRPIKDFLNQEDFEDKLRAEISVESLDPR